VFFFGSSKWNIGGKETVFFIFFRSEYLLYSPIFSLEKSEKDFRFYQGYGGNNGKESSG
jgi:hypothetical protein